MVWPRVARRLAALAVVTAARPVAEIDSCGLTNSIGNTAILMYTQVASKSKAAQSDLHSWLVRRDLESFRRQSSVSRFYFFAFCIVWLIMAKSSCNWKVLERLQWPQSMRRGRTRLNQVKVLNHS